MHRAQSTEGHEHETNDEKNPPDKPESNPAPDPPQRRNGLLAHISTNKIDHLSQGGWGVSSRGTHPFIQPAELPRPAGYGASSAGVGDTDNDPSDVARALQIGRYTP